MEEMKFCCPGFEYWCGEAGQRGFGIFAVVQDGSEPDFILQQRAVDLGAEIPSFAPAPLTLIAELYIHNCPWCGVSLKEFYRKTAKGIERSDLKLD